MKLKLVELKFSIVQKFSLLVLRQHRPLTLVGESILLSFPLKELPVTVFGQCCTKEGQLCYQTFSISFKLQRSNFGKHGNLMLHSLLAQYRKDSQIENSQQKAAGKPALMLTLPQSPTQKLTLVKEVLAPAKSKLERQSLFLEHLKTHDDQI